MALKIVNFGSSKKGLATVGYTIYGVDGAEAIARATTGVNEIGTNTGIYAANIILPDYDMVVLWDTGEATPAYATEDFQYQMTSIQNAVEPIQKIYNSIKNQGEFLSILMDRMGLLVKNEGLQKVSDKVDALANRDNVSLTNMEEAFNRAAGKINLTALAPTVNLPPINIPETKIPDYSQAINDLKSILVTIRGELMKVPKTQKEYSGNFTSIVELLNSLEQRLNRTVSDRSSEVMQRVDSVRTMFSKLDVLFSKMNTLSEKLNSLDVNDKDILKTKQEIMNDIKRLNQFVYDLVSSPYLKEAKDHANILLSFGHKRGK